MLSYLGPNMGPAPVAASLPPAVPGTMPDAVPSVPSTAAPMPDENLHAAISSAGHTPSSALAAILRRPGADLTQPNQPPPPPEYMTTTQPDGSILLHLKNPDGTAGIVVKVLPALKQSSSPQ